LCLLSTGRNLSFPAIACLCHRVRIPIL
jgi:hypothetical protein